MTSRSLSRFAFVLLSATALAQSTPQFSGVWTIDRANTAARSQRPGGASSNTPVAPANGNRAQSNDWTITQTATSLTIAHPLAGNTTQTFVYKLDGSPSVNVNGNATLETKSHWDAGRLVTEGTRTVRTLGANLKSSFKETRRLDPDGTMIVETTTQTGSGVPSTTIQAFSKKK